MMEMIVFLFLFAAGFATGVLIAVIAFLRRTGKRKKGFRKTYSGAGKEIDRRISEDIAAEQERDILHDPMEHYANKKFR